MIRWTDYPQEPLLEAVQPADRTYAIDCAIAAWNTQHANQAIGTGILVGIRRRYGVPYKAGPGAPEMYTWTEWYRRFLDYGESAFVGAQQSARIGFGAQ